MKTFSCIILVLLLMVICLPGCSKDSDQTVDALNAKALKLVQAGQKDQALAKAQAALEKSEKENGADHPKTAVCLETLGLVYQAMGDAGKVESTYLRALSIVKKSAGPESEEAAKVMNNLASLYYTQKQYTLAASFFKQSLAIAEKKIPADDPRLAVLRKNIGVCEGKQNGDGAAQPPEKQASAGESAATGGQAPAAMKNPPVNMAQDLVPQQVKDSMLKQLSQQNIFISDLEPRPPVVIDKKGVVFPYHALKKGKDTESAQEIIILFAAVSNPEKPNAVVFQQCRLISQTSYQAALEKGGVGQLQQEIREVFKSLYL
ncbi:MAG: tetratricopeptide repeat protein [Desulfobacteraceae bacterium]|nr:tetratricopeptide repeat protein [Desulfobacteraceae bacterium]